jgi:phage major head subunit gpT-like protein
VSFSTAFAKALVAIEDPCRALAMEVQSSSAIESYNWLGSVPGLKEWLDDRKLSKLRAEGFYVANKDWSNGLRVDKNDINDDKLNLVLPRIQMLAQKAGLHYGQLISQYLLAGFGTTLGPCYDGQALFSGAHQDDPTGPIQSNVTADPLSVAAYVAARAAMRQFMDDERDALGIVPNWLIVGPTQEYLARQIVQANLIIDPVSQSNVYAGTAQVLVTNAFSGAYANYWCLADLSTPFRPFLLQIREPITFTSVDQPEALHMFMHRQALYGAQGRHAAGYGLWQFIYGSTGIGSS